MSHILFTLYYITEDTDKWLELSFPSFLEGQFLEIFVQIYARKLDQVRKFQKISKKVKILDYVITQTGHRLLEYSSSLWHMQLIYFFRQKSFKKYGYT